MNCQHTERRLVEGVLGIERCVACGQVVTPHTYDRPSVDDTFVVPVDRPMADQPPITQAEWDSAATAHTRFSALWRKMTAAERRRKLGL